MAADNTTDRAAIATDLDRARVEFHRLLSEADQEDARTKVTKGPGSRAAGIAMAYKLIDAAQARWRAVNAPHLVALVRAGAVFHKGKLLERPIDITPERSTASCTAEVFTLTGDSYRSRARRELLAKDRGD